MKKISVIVKDKNTLVLSEDAKEGDYIDLSDLSKIDTSKLESLIEENKDIIYQNKLDDFKKMQDLKHNQEMVLKEKDFLTKISMLEQEISNFETNKNSILEKSRLEYQNEIQRIKYEKQLEIDKLNKDIDNLKSIQNQLVENEKLKLIQNYNKEIEQLNYQINTINQQHKLDISQKELEFNEKYNNIVNYYKNEISEKDNAYNMLQRQKASLNVKQTGEDLEAWCNNEMRQYRQAGLFNTTWIKDNDVIKDEGETKGSKADYIFRIYASDELNPNEELASVCLDMKDENPDSINKQTNEHYYKALNTNRLKKNCKYAVLVSNLETDKANDLPIFKAEGYKDMYVVRPAYMMTFLTMLTSLTTRFKDLLLEGNKEKMELLSSIELKNKFEELKLKYLDKPLESLNKKIEEIRKQSESIRKCSQKIDDTCDEITRNYLNEIQNKLTRFDLEIDKAYRKFDRANK